MTDISKLTEQELEQLELTIRRAFEILALDPVVEPKPIEYRLYYNKETGKPILYSYEEHPHDYLVLDQETYLKFDLNVIVINNKIVYPVHPRLLKMRPSEHGTKVHPYSWIIVSDSLDTDTITVQNYNQEDRQELRYSE